MTVRAGLQTIGLLTFVYLLVWTFVALGPVGWLVFGTLLAIGLAQAYRGQTRGDRGEGGADYCANCGAAVDLDAFEAVGDARPGWEVRHCTACGAPVSPDVDRDRGDESENCEACGAPNDPRRTTCKHCDAGL